MIRLIKAWLDACIAMFENWAAHVREDTAKYPESQWWRGYEQGVQDGREHESEVRR